MLNHARGIRISFVGGGSQSWAPYIVRDIILKDGLESVPMEIRLVDIDLPRARAIDALMRVKLADWNLKRPVTFIPTADTAKGLDGADFVVIAISTGRLPAMKNDLAIPERYGVYHTVGDTAGPGGWSRAWRNVPVFTALAREIRRRAPGAFVLNYTNPMAALTRALADVLPSSRVVGLCHGLFQNLAYLQKVFGLKSEKDLALRFAGLNHFFWILDFQVRGKDGYAELRKKMKKKSLGHIMKEAKADAMGHKSDRWFASELFAHYGHLPYFGDRHTAEFFLSPMTNLGEQKRLRLERTTIAQREKHYRDAERRIRLWTQGRKADWGDFDPVPSRETAADIIRAITLGETFSDIVNQVNAGQIPNLPFDAVVETMGYVSKNGIFPQTVGCIPANLVPTMWQHAECQTEIARAAAVGDEAAALETLAADPVCQHLSLAAIRKMGLELLAANKPFMPRRCAAAKPRSRTVAREG